jgi:hypothetical protein
MWAFSLKRERACRLQLLLVLANAAIFGSDSHGTRDDILLPQIQDFPNQEGQVPVLYTPGAGWPSCTLRHWVPFSSPPTRRATVEVFEPASTRGPLLMAAGPRYVYSLGMYRTVNTTFSSSTVVLCLSVDAITKRLLTHCLATGVLTELFPLSGCLCWLHNSCVQQICIILLS